MAEIGPHYDHYRVARERQPASPTRVGAAYIGEMRERDQDGWIGKVALTDGNEDAEIDVIVTGSEGGRPGMSVDERAIAEIVESLAGRFPAEHRLREMVEKPPLRLSSAGHGWHRVLGEPAT